jgi:hypothetical protein
MSSGFINSGDYYGLLWEDITIDLEDVRSEDKDRIRLTQDTNVDYCEHVNV